MIVRSVACAAAAAAVLAVVVAALAVTAVTADDACCAPRIALDAPHCVVIASEIATALRSDDARVADDEADGVRWCRAWSARMSPHTAAPRITVMRHPLASLRDGAQLAHMRAPFAHAGLADEACIVAWRDDAHPARELAVALPAPARASPAGAVRVCARIGSTCVLCPDDERAGANDTAALALWISAPLRETAIVRGLAPALRAALDTLVVQHVAGVRASCAPRCHVYLHVPDAPTRAPVRELAALLARGPAPRLAGVPRARWAQALGPAEADALRAAHACRPLTVFARADGVDAGWSPAERECIARSAARTDDGAWHELLHALDAPSGAAFDSPPEAERADVVLDARAGIVRVAQYAWPWNATLATHAAQAPAVAALRWAHAGGVVPRVTVDAVSRDAAVAVVRVLSAYLRAAGVHTVLLASGGALHVPAAPAASEAPLTVVLLTYRRATLAVDRVAAYCAERTLVRRVVVVSNDHTAADALAAAIASGRIDGAACDVVLWEPAANDLGNRFLVAPLVDTDAVLSVDDDLAMTHDDLVRLWRAYARRSRAIAGPFGLARRIAFGATDVDGPIDTGGVSYEVAVRAYNVMLTGFAIVPTELLRAFAAPAQHCTALARARAYVRASRNCEDVLMNLVANAVHGARVAPTAAYVRTEQLYDERGDAMEQNHRGHAASWAARRALCVSALVEAASLPDDDTAAAAAEECGADASGAAGAGAGFALAESSLVHLGDESGSDPLVMAGRTFDRGAAARAAPLATGGVPDAFARAAEQQWNALFDAVGADARASGSPNRTVAENDELVRELASALAQAFTHERVPNGASLLDVGCGNGDLLRALVRALGSAGALGAVHVLDVSGSAVALARRRLAAAMPVAAATARDISLPGDAFALPDAPFDVALLARVLEHVPVERRAAALRNALSVVARTGVVLLVAERGAVDGVADAAARAGGFDTPTVYELDAEAYSAAAAATHVVVALRPRADGA